MRKVFFIFFILGKLDFFEGTSLNLSCLSRCQEEFPAMEKTAPDTEKKTNTDTVSKECLEEGLDKDLDDADCKYTKDRV